MSNPTPTLPPTPSTIANLPLATTPLQGPEWVPISQNGVTSRVAANGFSVVGPTGPQGATGATGATGPQGPAGGAANISNGTIGQFVTYTSITQVGGVGLASGDIFVGNASNLPVAVAVSGDATLSNAGALTLAMVNSNVGSFTAATITVDAKGRITAASSGTAGNYVLISSQTISSSTASIQVTAGINNTYSHYIWEISNLTSVSNGVDAVVTVQQGGIFIGGTNYTYTIMKAGTGSGAVGLTQSTGAANFPVTTNGTSIQNTSTQPSSIVFEFWNPATASQLDCDFKATGNGGSSAYLAQGVGTVITSAATTGIKLALTSGNIATCQANLYGIT